jgi:predicted membrane GTPase involved in stress response
MKETVEDGIVEVTPGSIRLRKRDLDAQTRMAHYREEKWA